MRRRTHEHACDFARQHRAHRGARRCVHVRQGGARSCRRRCDAAGRPRHGRDARGVRRRDGRVPRRPGFVAGLAGRAAARRPLVWVRQDFTEIESGALSMSGLAELGLDPRLLVTVRAADVDTALRTAADALACDALGVVVLEVWGEARQLDLVASRKLTLAAQASGVTGLLLRVAAEPLPSTAETRWIVRAAHSPPAAPSRPAWGAPMFDAQLVRNRHGPVGRWIMEWKCDECLFEKPAAYPQPVAAAPAHRPHQAPASRGNAAQAFSSEAGPSREANASQIDHPASSSPSKTTRCRFSRSMMPPPVSALRSACRSPMPAPSARN